MAHTLGGHYNIAHGVACAVLLPHAMDFSLIAVPEKFVRIAEALGEKTQGLPLTEAAAMAIEAVVKLSEDIGIPENLEQLGVTEDGIEQMSKDAVQSGHSHDDSEKNRLGRHSSHVQERSLTDRKGRREGR